MKTVSDLKKEVGNTPVERILLENNNVLIIKDEFCNLYGSHYDRVYLALYDHYQKLGVIKPGDKVIETTSGSAGVSFAGIGRDLGYRCLVALPKGGEKAREQAISELLQSPNDLLFTPEDLYVNGFPGFIRRYLVQNKEVFFLNHSMGPKGAENNVATTALESIIDEVSERIDYFVPAVGNGTSILGPGRKLKKINPDAKIIAFETMQSAVGYDLLFPGNYMAQFGIEPGTMKRHQLPGTSFQGIDFPHIRSAVQERLLDDVILIKDASLEKEYNVLTGKTLPDLVNWEIATHPVGGRTTRAGIAVARYLAKSVSNKTFLILGYDTNQRYDIKY